MGGEIVTSVRLFKEKTLPALLCGTQKAPSHARLSLISGRLVVTSTSVRESKFCAAPVASWKNRFPAPSVFRTSPASPPALI